jgi:transglutaminase-like putative cysteine protease
VNDSFLTRHSLFWLLAAQAVVIIPRLDILPVWTALIWIVAAFWYWRIYRGDWNFPPRTVTWGLSLVAIIGIAVEYRTALGLEPQVALLITAFSLKLLELKSVRDHWLLLMLSYFIVGCGFVFSTSMSTVALALCQLGVLLMAQQSLFRPRMALRPMLWNTSTLLAQSIPLMLVIFVVFPRFGPLWTVPLPGEGARTGVSDRMSPGDISKLSRSTALAFRASFDDELPLPSTLYWRGLVLENFDGREWSRDKFGRLTFIRPRKIGNSVNYEIILEHGVHEWLLAIPLAEVERDGVHQDGRFQLLPKAPLIGRVRYTVKSYPASVLDAPLDRYLRFKNLELPTDYNPQARAMAEPWRELATVDRVAAAERFFNERPFVYTLEPPKLGRDSVDEFLFGSQRGFCEHYASSFVFMMRAAGVPARVVVGYQGGERNEAGDYLLVHQSDAHAWAEVWLDGPGWVRVDPTAWVAPIRIELGADAALAGQAGYLADGLISLRKMRGIQFIAELRMLMDRAEYQWVKWIINYDTDRQWDVLRKLFGKIDNQYLGLIILFALALPMIAAGLMTVGWPRKTFVPPAVQAYSRCITQLEAQGCKRGVGEAPRDFAARVTAELPEYASWLNKVTDAFYRAYYRPLEGEGYQLALAELRKLRRTFPGNSFETVTRQLRRKLS